MGVTSLDLIFKWIKLAILLLLHNLHDCIVDLFLEFDSFLRQSISMGRVADDLGGPHRAERHLSGLMKYKT